MSKSIFHKSLETDLNKIGGTLDAFKEYCLNHLGSTEEAKARVTDLKIALAELLNNVVLHACSLHSHHCILLEAKFNEHGLKILLCDDGIELPKNLLNSEEVSSPLINHDDLPEKGFGWFLIHNIFDVTSYQREGGASHGHNRLILQEKYVGSVDDLNFDNDEESQNSKKYY